MLVGLKTLVALIKGKVVVVIQRDNNKADVVIGKSLTRQYALSSLAGAIKALML